MSHSKSEILTVGDEELSIAVHVLKLLELSEKERVYVAELLYSYEPGRILGVARSIEGACNICLQEAIDGYSADAWQVTEESLND